MSVGKTKKRASPVTWLLVIVCICVICFAGGKTIPDATGVSALNDVFGYWGVAATLAGKDWSPLLSTVEYYAGGYSILLVPLFWLGLTAKQMFQIALAMNVAFLLGCFILCIACIRYLFRSLPLNLIVLISFASTVYTSNLVQAQEAWSETLMIFLFWLIFYLLLKMLQRPSYGNGILLALATGYLYFVHLRSIGIFIAVILTMLVCMLGKRITKRHFVVIVFVLLVLFILQSLFKNWELDAVFKGSSNAINNTYAGQGERLLSIISSPEYFVAFLQSAIGKLFYFGAATIFLGFISVHAFIKDIYSLIVDTVKNKVLHLSVQKVVSVFLLLSFCACYGIGCLGITSIYGGSLSLVIYGRYFEYCFGPIIAVGLAFLVVRCITKGQFLLYSIIELILAFITNDSLIRAHNTGSTDFFWPAAPALQKIYETINCLRGFCIYLCLICIFVFMIMVFLIQWGQKTVEHGTVISWWMKIRFLGNYIAVGLVAVIYLWSSSCYTSFMEYQSSVGQENEGAVQLFEENGIPDTIYLILTKDDIEDWEEVRLKYTGPKFLQARLPDTTIEYFMAEEGQVNPPQDAQIYMTLSSQGSEFLEENIPGYVWIYSCSRYNLFAKEDSVYAAGTEQEPTTIWLQKMGLGTGGTIEVQNKNGSWTPVYEEGTSEFSKVDLDLSNKTISLVTAGNENTYDMYGPGISLQPGSYRALITLECLNLDECEDNTLGQCDISAEDGTRIISVFPLTKDLFEGGGAKTLALDFSSAANSALNRIEFRLYSSCGAKFRITDISYQYLSPQVKVLLPDSDDFDVVDGLVSMDSEFLPFYIGASEYQQKLLDDSEIAAELSAKGHQVSIVSLEEIASISDAFLLIPADETDLISSLLPQYTILARLQNYALLAPSSSDVCNNFRDNGGRVLSNGSAISLRYYAGAVSNAASSTQATLPEGQYRLDYEVQVAGASVFDSCGTLVISYSDQKNEIPLTKELFAYDVYRGSLSENVVLEENTKISAQVTTIPEVSGAQLDVWVTPLS